MWKDKVRNEEIGRKTGLRKLELIIKERRLRWLGHVLRMENSRIPRQATQWELRGYKRKPGRPRKSQIDIIRRDLKDMVSVQFLCHRTYNNIIIFLCKIPIAYYQATRVGLRKILRTPLNWPTQKITGQVQEFVMWLFYMLIYSWFSVKILNNNNNNNMWQ